MYAAPRSIADCFQSASGSSFPGLPQISGPPAWPSSPSLSRRCWHRSRRSSCARTTGRSFAVRRGQGASAETGLPLQWSESTNVTWKAPVPGRGWSSPVVAGDRVWLTTAVDDGRHLAARAGLRRRDRTPGRQHRGVPQAPVAAPQPEEQLGVADADHRRRSRLRALRRRRHGGADDRRRGGVEGALSLRVAARRRRVAGALRRSADFQLRRQRHRVRRRARQADGTGALENAAPPAGGSGVLDAARDPGRRSRSAGQRRRLPGGRLRSGVGPRDLAGQLRRRLLERAASGVRPRTGLHLDRLPGAVAAGGACRRHRRRDAQPHRVDAGAGGAAHAVAAARRRPALRRERHRRGVLSRREDGRAALAPTARGQLLGFAGPRRRPHLLPERRGTDDRDHARDASSSQLATSEIDGATLASMAVSRGSFFLRTVTHLYRINEATHALP